MEIPILTTPRLILQPWSLSDADRLFTILQEADMFKYFPQTRAPERPWVDMYIKRHLSHWQEHGYGHWAVANRADGEVIGWNGLEYLPETGETEVAYLLSRQAWGRGFATEAAGAALEFGLVNCHLHPIIGLVHPDNVGSIRVLEKTGLVYKNRANYWGLELLRYVTP